MFIIVILRRTYHEQRCCQIDCIFEPPFWRGIFERIWEGELTVCKVTFGAEPKDYEIEEFLLKNYYQLRFGPPVGVSVKEAAHNRKRKQREVKRQIHNTEIGTKSQQALKLQQEQSKTERKILNRRQQEEEKQRRFEKNSRRGKKSTGADNICFNFLRKIDRINKNKKSLYISTPSCYHRQRNTHTAGSLACL